MASKNDIERWEGVAEHAVTTFFDGPLNDFNMQCGEYLSIMSKTPQFLKPAEYEFCKSSYSRLEQAYERLGAKYGVLDDSLAEIKHVLDCYTRWHVGQPKTPGFMADVETIQHVGGPLGDAASKHDMIKVEPAQELSENIPTLLHKMDRDIASGTHGENTAQEVQKRDELAECERVYHSLLQGRGHIELQKWADLKRRLLKFPVRAENAQLEKILSQAHTILHVVRKKSTLTYTDVENAVDDYNHIRVKLTECERLKALRDTLWDLEESVDQGELDIVAVENGFITLEHLENAIKLGFLGSVLRHKLWKCYLLRMKDKEFVSKVELHVVMKRSQSANQQIRIMQSAIRREMNRTKNTVMVSVQHIIQSDPHIFRDMMKSGTLRKPILQQDVERALRALASDGGEEHPFEERYFSIMSRRLIDWWSSENNMTEGRLIEFTKTLNQCALEIHKYPKVRQDLITERFDVGAIGCLLDSANNLSECNILWNSVSNTQKEEIVEGDDDDGWDSSARALVSDEIQATKRFRENGTEVFPPPLQVNELYKAVADAALGLRE
jgi:hypothetical protein